MYCVVAQEKKSEQGKKQKLKICTKNLNSIRNRSYFGDESVLVVFDAETRFNLVVLGRC